MAKKISEREIELFLLENTEFFLTRESRVDELQFKHDTHGASSLLEMQVRRLREEQDRLMEMLSNFVSTGRDNEELFFKSKDLTLALIASEGFDSTKKTVEVFFKKNFAVDFCGLELVSDLELKQLEAETGLSMDKNAIHMGPFSKEKIRYLFHQDDILSGVISIFKLPKSFGILKIGSKNQTKYLGDGDTDFIEYIRDVIASILESKDG